MNNEKVLVYPWDQRSKGAKALSSELGIKRIKAEGSTFKGGSGFTVINWGSSNYPDSVIKSAVINSKEAVEGVVNKLIFFKQMQSRAAPPRIPEFTEKTSEAVEWAKKGHAVMARTSLTGSGGKGIVFLDDLSDFLSAKLYTIYKKKKEEFRIHIAFGKVFLTQKKTLRQVDDEGNRIDPKGIDFRIRNLKNGFIFRRHDVSPPVDVVTQAKLAMIGSGLDFGAVDVIYNQSEEKAYVLEINCAPGLEGTTIKDYAQVFREHFQ